MELHALLHDDELLDQENGHTTRVERNTSIPDSFRHCLHTISNFGSNFSRTRNSAAKPSHPFKHYFSSAASLVPGALNFLLPQFLRWGNLRQARKLHDTSYLDALRGWAAVIVCIGHTLPFTKHWIFRLPFIRILIQGPAMVYVFFVISGYVLSYRMLKLMRNREALSLLDAFISSIFRRWIRLYGSTGIATFAAMLLVWFRLSNPSNRQETFLLQLKHWMLDFAHFSYPLAKNIDGVNYSSTLASIYLHPTWTIPVEFRGSILVFAFCIGACKLSTRNRMALCWFFIICSYFFLAIYVAMFLGGLFIADLSFTRHPEQLNPPTHLPVISAATLPLKEPSRQTLRTKIFVTSVLILSLFLLGQPGAKELPQAYWPWPVFHSLIPSFLGDWRQQEIWWFSIGSFLLVWALDTCPMLQTPLRWTISQYFGDLSFGIYLTHWLVIWTVWEPILSPLRIFFFGNEQWTLIPFYIFYFLIVLWVSDLFVKVDKQVVTFARWFQKKTFIW